jgi:succinyldiaminopimelate transaminase
MKLPDFPWDALAPYKQRASEHPEGIVDLSIGTPVDATPEIMQDALKAASNTPGYPTTIGTAELRDAMRGWLGKRLKISDATDQNKIDVLPTIGSKELVGWLPTFLEAKRVIIPEVAYPTYAVGALVAGAEVIPVSLDPDTWPELNSADLVWINSPSNPTGQVSSPELLRKIISWSRARGVTVASDECYIDFGWDADPQSILSVADGDYTGLLSVHSLSKSSNAAGYRAAFMAGDPKIIGKIRELRKHLGMMLPLPIQQAMTAALNDRNHVAGQRDRYSARRQMLKSALLNVGFQVDHSEAGLYLWVTRGNDCWADVAWMAEHGILATPGIFYGELGAKHLRVALTSTDAHIASAAKRLIESKAL